MNRTILYYPTINIPNDEWLRHALLYYDQVSSIIPQNWENESLIQLSPDIEYLIGENQFRPIKPDNLITGGNNWQEFDEFQNEFQGIASNSRFKNIVNRRRPFYGIHHSKTHLNSEYRIHSNKTSDSIFYFLEELGLARRSENPEWLLFEEHTALLYMALLAKYLADIDENQTTIGTDQKVYENYNFKKVNEENSFPVVSVSFDRILPVPRPNVPLERIIDFKRRRGDNLEHFKKILSDFQLKVSKTQSQAEFKEACVTFKETLTNGVNDLNEVIADARIETVVKGFKSMISLKTPPGIAAAGVALNEYFNLAHIPFNYEAFSVGALGLVEIAGSYIEARNRERARLRESPFSYLYYANKRGITYRQR